MPSNPLFDANRAAQITNPPKRPAPAPLERDDVVEVDGESATGQQVRNPFFNPDGEGTGGDPRFKKYKQIIQTRASQHEEPKETRNDNEVPSTPIKSNPLFTMFSQAERPSSSQSSDIVTKKTAKANPAEPRPKKIVKGPENRFLQREVSNNSVSSDIQSPKRLGEDRFKIFSQENLQQLSKKEDETGQDSRAKLQLPKLPPMEVRFKMFTPAALLPGGKPPVASLLKSVDLSFGNDDLGMMSSTDALTTLAQNEGSQVPHWYPTSTPQPKEFSKLPPMDRSKFLAPAAPLPGGRPAGARPLKSVDLAFDDDDLGMMSSTDALNTQAQNEGSQVLHNAPSYPLSEPPAQVISLHTSYHLTPSSDFSTKETYSSAPTHFGVQQVLPNSREYSIWSPETSTMLIAGAICVFLTPMAGVIVYLLWPSESSGRRRTFFCFATGLMWLLYSFILCTVSITLWSRSAPFMSDVYSPTIHNIYSKQILIAQVILGTSLILCLPLGLVLMFIGRRDWKERRTEQDSAIPWSAIKDNIKGCLSLIDFCLSFKK
jgi:hypothetical protein